VCPAVTREVVAARGSVTPQHLSDLAGVDRLPGGRHGHAGLCTTLAAAFASDDRLAVGSVRRPEAGTRRRVAGSVTTPARRVAIGYRPKGDCACQAATATVGSTILVKMAVVLPCGPL
jgi:hypothetical protein